MAIVRENAYANAKVDPYSETQAAVAWAVAGGAGDVATVVARGQVQQQWTALRAQRAQENKPIVTSYRARVRMICTSDGHCKFWVVGELVQESRARLP